MKLQRAALLIIVLLLAGPVLAQNRLPAPKIFGIKLSEYQHGRKGETSWCVGVAWKRVPGARNGINPNRPNKIPNNTLKGYAIRLWTKGNNAPDFVDHTFSHEGSSWKLAGGFAPSTSKWSNIHDMNYKSASAGRKNLTVTVCGYAPHQEINLRVRAIDENRKNGEVSKKFTVNLPELGAYGKPEFFNHTDYPSRGRVVYGKWISW